MVHNPSDPDGLMLELMILYNGSQMDEEEDKLLDYPLPLQLKLREGHSSVQ